MNNITIIGNMGKDPELAYNSAGTAVCKFTVSTHHKKNRDAAEDTTWHNVVCFGQIAENVAETMGKGQRVIVIGRFEKRQYQKKDGTTAYADSVVADDIGPNLRFHTCEVSRPSRDARGAENAPAGPHTDEEPF